jgi:Domain of unknown function (DUF4384)
MISRRPLTRRSSIALAVLSAASLLAHGVGAQSDTTRLLWDTALIEKKTYKIVTPQVPVASVKPDRVVGVTVWQLREPARTDTGERLLAHQAGEAEEWIPSRVAADKRLVEGDRVRLSIEAARGGYLYVIDREHFSDGTSGDPYLIFPTTATRGGDNRVAAGRVVEIPAQDDAPPYFRLRRSRPDQTAEVLNIVVSWKPLDGLTIGDKPVRVPAAQLAAWERSWGGPLGRLEMPAGVGRTWTKVEKDAGSDRQRSLTQDEPRPQTIFYRANSKADEPVMVKLTLRYDPK